MVDFKSQLTEEKFYKFYCHRISILAYKYLFLFVFNDVRISYSVVPVASKQRSLPGYFKSSVFKNWLKTNICVPVLQAKFVSLCHQAPIGVYTAIFFYLESIHQCFWKIV